MFNLRVDTAMRSPQAIDWRSRQNQALIGFVLDEEGLPVNPVEPHLPRGCGDMWHWGEAVVVDAIVTATDKFGHQKLLLIERGDGHGWALPGGFLDPGETPREAVARELHEETGLNLPQTHFQLQEPRYVPDPRAGRAAWVVTIPGITHLCAPLPDVAGADDARRAEWVPADTYTQLRDAVDALGSRIFASHLAMLQDMLD